MSLPLITQKQAETLIGVDRFNLMRECGFIRAFGLKDLPSDLYDRKQVETAPWRAKMSFLCNEGKRQNKYKLAIGYVGQFIKP